LTGLYLLEYSVVWCILSETSRYLLCDFWWFLEFTCWVAFITKVTARNICLHFVIYVLCYIHYVCSCFLYHVL